MITFKWLTFSELSTYQLYDILALRADVFVVEQNIAYTDPDGKDLLAHHLLGIEDNKLVAYLRLFPPTEINNYIKFGRVLTSQSVRTKGYGKKLIQELIDYCNKQFTGIPIKCSAQQYLLKFYQSFGFDAQGESYIEEGIPHIAMQKS